MRKSSPAKSEASSPPVPARISRITFLSSFGSLGSSSNFSSRSTVSRRRFELVLFVVRHLLHFGVVRFRQHLLGALQAFLDFLPLAVFRHHFGHLRVRLGELLVTRRIVVHFGRGKLLRQLVVARLDLFEFFETASNSPWRYLKDAENRKGKSENWIHIRGSAAPGGVERYR